MAAPKAPLPPDPFAEVKARFGQENLEAILATYRAFADKVDYRKLLDWKITQGPEGLLQPLFLAALAAITKELDLGAVAAELQAAQSAEVAQSALAESLAATVRDLDAHIERRAQEIAGPQVAEARQRAAERVAELERDAAFQKQRHEDLERELRRQLDGAVKSRDREFAELKDLRELRKCVIQQLTVKATSPHGERWADYDALAAAVFPATEATE